MKVLVKSSMLKFRQGIRYIKIVQLSSELIKRLDAISWLNEIPPRNYQFIGFYFSFYNYILV